MVLTTGDFTQAPDPFELFQTWLDEAEENEPNDANAMAVSSVDSDGLPNVRMVLLKWFDQDGFVFYTNQHSDKGQELAHAPKAALLFHWKSLRRQIRIRGMVSVVSEQMADEYFASRGRGSQLGAWASQQSRPLADRSVLEREVANQEQRFLNQDVTRPPHWLGYRVRPLSIEFWQDRRDRLHDRVRFDKDKDGWQKTRLYP